MLLGAIDIGTNSVLLAIARRAARGELAPVLERATITRLGEGVDQARALSPAAIERTLACLEAYGAELRREGVTALDVVGTSAMRDAAGGEAFRARAGELLGVVPRVIAGEEEARLTFKGGLSGLDVGDEEPALVFDIGGGSTEFIRGTRALGPASGASVSLDVGSVRLTERCGARDRWDADGVAKLDAEIAKALAALAGTAGGARVVGVAGTTTSLFAVAHAVDPYDAARVHGGTLTRREVAAVFERLAGSTQAEREALPGLSPKRADVIVAGARLCQRILERLDAERLVVSDRGVRWGLLIELADRAAH